MEKRQLEQKKEEVLRQYRDTTFTDDRFERVAPDDLSEVLAKQQGVFIQSNPEIGAALKEEKSADETSRVVLGALGAFLGLAVRQLLRRRSGVEQKVGKNGRGPGSGNGGGGGGALTAVKGGGARTEAKAEGDEFSYAEVLEGTEQEVDEKVAQYASENLDEWRPAASDYAIYSILPQSYAARAEGNQALADSLERQAQQDLFAANFRPEAQTTAEYVRNIFYSEHGTLQNLNALFLSQTLKNWFLGEATGNGLPHHGEGFYEDTPTLFVEFVHALSGVPNGRAVAQETYELLSTKEPLATLDMYWLLEQVAGGEALKSHVLANSGQYLFLDYFYRQQEAKEQGALALERKIHGVEAIIAAAPQSVVVDEAELELELSRSGELLELKMFAPGRAAVEAQLRLDASGGVLLPDGSTGDPAAADVWQQIYRQLAS